MADEKSKNLTGADGPDKDPAQPEAGGSPAPGKAQKAPEAAAPEKTVKEPENANHRVSILTDFPTFQLIIF